MLMSSDINHFEQYSIHQIDNKRSRDRNQDTISLLLSSFGNEVIKCCPNFLDQGMEFKDFASLTKDDLQLFGITNLDKQMDMINIFSQLTKQEYSLNEIKHSVEGQKYNSQIIENATLYLDTMAMTLDEANAKLILKPAGDVIIDDKNYASKFVIDALKELDIMTDEIKFELRNLGKNTYKNERKNKKIGRYVFIGFLASLCLAFVVWKPR